MTTQLYQEEARAANFVVSVLLSAVNQEGSGITLTLYPTFVWNHVGNALASWDGNPHLLAVTGLRQNGYRGSSGTIMLRNRGPWIGFRHAPAAVYTWQSFNEFRATHSLKGQTVVFYVERIAGPEGAKKSVRTRLGEGEIQTVENASAESVGITFSTLGAWEWTDLPLQTVDQGVLSTEEILNGARTAKGTQAAPVPYVFGSFLPDQDQFQTITTSPGMTETFEARDIIRLGYDSPVSPMPLIIQNGDESRYAMADGKGGKQVGTVDTARALIWIHELQQFGELYRTEGVDEGWAAGNAPENGVHCYSGAPLQPWVRAAVPLTDWNENHNHFNPERAGDQDPTTFSRIIWPNEYNFVRFPSVSAAGRVAANTEDGGTGTFDYDPGGPIGFELVACFVAPKEPGFPTGGQVEWGLCHPGGSINNLFLAFRTIDLPTTPGEMKVSTIPIRYTQGAWRGRGDGWAGTRWTLWDFNHPGSIADDDDDADKPLSQLDNEDRTPFLVYFRWVNQPVEAVGLFISHVALRVGFRYRADAYQPEFIGPKPGKGKPYNNNRSPRYSYGDIGWHGRYVVGSRRVVSYGRRRESHNPQFALPERQQVGNLFAARVGYLDASGLFGTAGAPIQDPATAAAFIVKQELGRTPYSGASHGSVVNAKQDLDQWVSWATGGDVTSWSQEVRVQETSSADETLRRLVEELPFPLMWTNPTSRDWCLSVWLPGSPRSVSRFLGDTFWVDPMVHVMHGSSGPAIEYVEGDESEVLTEIRASYSYHPGRNGYRRTAAATPEWSDNGAHLHGFQYLPRTPWDNTEAHSLLARALQLYKGPRRANLEWPNIHRWPEAVALTLAQIWRRTMVVPRVRFSGSNLFARLVPGMFLRFTDTTGELLGYSKPHYHAPGTWAETWWRVVEVEPTLGAVPEWVVTVEWHPLTIGLGGGFASTSEAGGLDEMLGGEIGSATP